jgi:hypothetical protein
MKNIFCSILLMAMFLYSCGPTHVVVETQAPPQQAVATPPAPPEVSYQSFYDELSPYGSWIDYPGYGYVWLPNVGPDFKPYSSNGHWVFTDAGWTWASDYDWGWATFHYGRWFFDNTYGWMWIPGYEWAPAWVSWRKSPDYYGWAPLGPGVSGNGANVYIAAGSYNPPSNYWCFVSPQYVTSPHVNNYYVNETRNVTIINNTTIINTTVTNNNISNSQVNNTTVNNNYRNVYTAGPDRGEVERVTGGSIKPIPIQTSNRPGASPGANGQFALYRPRVNPALNTSTAGTQQKPAPARIVPLNNVPARPHHNAEEIGAPTSSGNQGERPGGNQRPAAAAANGSVQENAHPVGNVNPAVNNNNNPNPAAHPVSGQVNQPATNNNPNNPAFNRPSNPNNGNNPARTNAYSTPPNKNPPAKAPVITTNAPTNGSPNNNNKVNPGVKPLTPAQQNAQKPATKKPKPAVKPKTDSEANKN